MMFGPRASPRYSPAPRWPPTSGRRDPDRHGADRVGALAQGVDVVGEQPRMAVEDLGQGLVDGSVERVDGAVALGRRAPLVIARSDDDRATTPGVGPGRHGPAGEVQGVRGWFCHRPISVASWCEPLPVVADAAAVVAVPRDDRSTS